MAGGDGFAGRDRQLIDATIRDAEQLSRFEFSVYVGPAHEGDTRRYATRLHNSLTAPAISVLILVDLDQRAVEVVTGGRVRAVLDDATVQGAVERMQADFAAHDVVGGINRAVTHLAETAAARRT